MEAQQTDNWDKLATVELKKLGLSWEDARKAVGIIAEHRQKCYLQGYNKGYNDGVEVGLGYPKLLVK